MPDPSAYHLEYRPKTYWVYDDPLQRVQATVKGTVRRATAALALEGEISVFADPYASAPSLPDDERQARGAIHPMLMGGEYLTDLLASEVEIARVELASTTGDVMSIRARWEGDAIHYRVVDEYEGDYQVEPLTSAQPLTLGELIHLIDTAGDPNQTPEEGEGLVMPYVLMNHEYGTGDPEELLDFATVSSGFYPGLESWYAEAIQEWCDGVLEEIRRDLDGDAIQRLAAALLTDAGGVESEIGRGYTNDGASFVRNLRKF